MNESAGSAIARLRAMSTSPHPPEPPRQNRAVDALMALATRRRHGSVVTPHLHGGSSIEKVEWEYARADSLWDALRGFFGPELLAGLDVLDAGCGWGGKAIRYAETAGLKSIVGFDLPGIFEPDVPAGYASARGLRNCTFTSGYAEQMPFEDERFDVVLMEDVLEHVADPPSVLAECRRVLRSGGKLVARLPSIRMLTAHHLDRAFVYPGAHYILPMRTWAAGLNHYLLSNTRGVRFEPFSEVVDTRYHRGVTRNLNGMDLADFRQMVATTDLEISALELVGYPASKFRARFGTAGGLLHATYERLRALPGLREPLSMSIILVAEKRSEVG